MHDLASKWKEVGAAMQRVQEHSGLVMLQEFLKQLRSDLLAKEMHMFDVLNELLRSFDRNYSELVEQNKQMIMQFFANTRDLEGTFNGMLVQLGQKLYEEKYNIEVSLAGGLKLLLVLGTSQVLTVGA